MRALLAEREAVSQKLRPRCSAWGSYSVSVACPDADRGAGRQLAAPEGPGDAAATYVPEDLVPAGDRGRHLVHVGDAGFGLLSSRAEASAGREPDADGVGSGDRTSKEGADLGAVCAFVRRSRVRTEAAGDVGAVPGADFFRRFFDRSRRWGRRWRGSLRSADRARTRQVLAGGAVVVPVEVVGVTRQQVFLRFGLVGEVGAVVVERPRRGWRRLRGDDGEREGDQ